MFKYEFGEVTCESMFEDMGDDICHYHYTIIVEEPEEFCYTEIIPFSDILNYVELNHPELYKTLIEIRHSTGNWGPKESKIIMIAESRGIDLGEIGKEHVIQRGYLEANYLHWKKWSMNTEGQEKLQKSFKHLQEVALEAKPYVSRRIEFCEEMEEAVNKIVLKYYPELLETDAEYIVKLGNVMWDIINDAHTKISDLAYYARKGE